MMSCVAGAWSCNRGGGGDKDQERGESAGPLEGYAPE